MAICVLKLGIATAPARQYTPQMATHSRNGPRPGRPKDRQRPGAKKPAAAPARMVALDLLDAVMGRGLPLQDSIANHPDYGGLEPRDRRFCRRLVSLALRHHGEARAMLAPHVKTLPKGKNRRAAFALIMATAEMVMGGGEAHAVVDQSVRLVKASDLGHLGGLTNAVLRKIAANVEALGKQTPDPWVNFPAWLAGAIRSDWGGEADRVARSLMAPPALDLTPKDPGEAPALAEELGGLLLPCGSVRLAEGHVPALPGYDEGRWWVQDAAASLPLRLMGDIRGARVADFCAAPGGKTAQCCAAGARTTAIDSSAARMKRLQENMARLNLDPEPVVADAMDYAPETPFDAVLIDAPCSATGTIRRRPDILCHETPPDFAALRRTQRGLLDASARMLKPGGVVVYAVCSLLKREGEEIVRTPPEGLEPMPFTEAEQPPGFATDASDGAHMTRLMPDALSLDSGGDLPQGNDGFFIARFTRS